MPRMQRCCFIWLTALALTALAMKPAASAQQPDTSTADAVFLRFDKNKDGKLVKQELPPGLLRLLTRADADKDGVLTKDEIEKSGIRIRFTRPAGQNGRSREFTIPAVKDLMRVDRDTRPTRQAMINSAFVLKTQTHAVQGDKYVIVTDHVEPSYRESLARLAKYRQGVILQVDDLSLLYKDPQAVDELRRKLRDVGVRYVAIAPRPASFRENMLLGMWQILATLDDDPQLDAYPGVLLASDPQKFAALIDRSIQHKVVGKTNSLRPFAISQVRTATELRSLQKAGVMRKMFAALGYATPTLAIYGTQARNALKLEADDIWNVHCETRQKFVRQLPEPAAQEFHKASLVIMHGHGIPGMSCGLDVDGIPRDFSGKVLLCGSCFSAAPAVSDLPAMSRAPGGYTVGQRDAFAQRAIDNGATVVFAHMRLNSGFPHLFPVLESWMAGQSVGQAYQQLLNALIALQDLQPDQFVVRPQTAGRRLPQNRLLYVVFGDPALTPLGDLSAKPKTR